MEKGIKSVLKKRRQEVQTFIRGWTVTNIYVADDDNPGLCIIMRKKGKPFYRTLQIFFGGNSDDNDDYGICCEMWQFQEVAETEYSTLDDNSILSSGPVVSYVHDLEKGWARTHNEYLQDLARDIWAKHFYGRK